MTYPQPDLENSLDLIKYVNDISGGWFVPGVLLAFGIVIFILSKYQDYKDSSCAVIATTGCFIIGALFWVGGLLSGQIIVFILALDILCVLWAKFDS